MAGISKGTDENLTGNVLELNNTQKDITENLFQKEEDLLNNVNPEFSSSAKEEFDEMKSKYERAKSRNKGGLDKKLNELKLEFSKDIEGLEKISNYSDIPNYETFKSLITSNSLGNFIEESIFKTFNKYSEEQIRNGIGEEFPVDKTGVKVMKKNIEKGINIKEKVTIKNNISNSLADLDNNKDNIKDIQNNILKYIKEYGKDEFSIQGLIKIRRVEKEETETRKKETEKQDNEMNDKIEKRKNKIVEFSYVLGEERMSKYFPEANKIISTLNLTKEKIGFEPGKKGEEKMKEISKDINNAWNIIDKIEPENIQFIFAELKKKVDEDKKKIEERGIKLDSEEGKNEIKKLGSYNKYIKVYREFKTFSPNLSQKVDLVTSPGGIINGNENNGVTEIEKWKLKNAGIDTDNSKISGNLVYQPGEDGVSKGADLSKIPPEVYLVTKEGYKLNTDLPKVPDDLIDERKKVSEDIIKNNDKITKKTDNLNNRLINLQEMEKKGDDTTEIKQKIIKLKEEIKELQEKNKDLEKSFMKKLNVYSEGVKVEQEKKQEKQKETLKFLSKTGFDLIPQHITNQLIDTININPKSYGFDTKIDLENGILGFKNVSVEDLGIEHKKMFAKLFLKAIGNPGKDLINIDNIGAALGDSLIKNPSHFNLYLNQEGYKGFGTASKMLKNLSEKEL